MFSKIKGHNLTKKRLSNLINTKRFSNAYIFSGPEGVGKKEIAQEFSSHILGVDIDSSPDFYLIEPLKGEKSIKIDQIRKLNSNMSLKPYGEYKIYLVDDADRMTIQAQNALLKTLEEPSDYGIIILVTKNEQTLLDTIRSRCVEIKFSPLDTEDVKSILIDRGVSTEVATVSAIFSRGSVGNAISISQNTKLVELRTSLEIYLEKILVSSDKYEAMAEFDTFKTYSDSIFQIIDLLKIYIRDAILIRETKNSKLLINIDSENLISKISKKLSLSQLGKIMDIIDDTELKLRANCNFNSTIQTMSINIYEVVNKW